VSDNIENIANNFIKKKWQKSGKEEDREAYKQKRRTNKEVAKAKKSSCEEWQRRSS